MGSKEEEYKEIFLAEAHENHEELNKLSVYRVQLEEGLLKSHRLAGSDVAFARTQIENDLR